jgi:hypothetical protein
MTNPVAGDPSRWGYKLGENSRYGGSRYYHAGCVDKAFRERDAFLMARDEILQRFDKLEEEIKNIKLQGLSPIDAIENAVEAACTVARKNECMSAGTILLKAVPLDKPRKSEK